MESERYSFWRWIHGVLGDSFRRKVWDLQPNDKRRGLQMYLLRSIILSFEGEGNIPSSPLQNFLARCRLNASGATLYHEIRTGFLRLHRHRCRFRNMPAVRTNERRKITYLEPLLSFGMLALVWMPVPRKGSIPLGNSLLCGFFLFEGFIVESQNSVAIEFPAKDILGIVIRPPVKMGFCVEGIDGNFLCKFTASTVAGVFGNSIVRLECLPFVLWRRRRVFVGHALAQEAHDAQKQQSLPGSLRRGGRCHGFLSLLDCMGIKCAKSCVVMGLKQSSTVFCRWKDRVDTKRKKLGVVFVSHASSAHASDDSVLFHV